LGLDSYIAPSRRCRFALPFRQLGRRQWIHTPNAAQLPTVVITSQKNPDQSTLTQPDLPTARRRIEQTPGGANVIDAESYTGGRVSTLSDALGYAAGVLVQSRFGAEEARISIRGSGLQRTFYWTRLSSKTVYRPDAQQQLELFLHVSDKHLYHPIFQVFEQRNRDYGIEARYIVEGELAGRRNRLVIGIAPSYGSTDEDRYVNVGGDAGGRTNASKQTARNLELYAENQHYVRSDVALVAGVQRVRSMRKLDDRFIAGTAADPVSKSFDQRYTATNPKLGLRWDYTASVQLFANVSRSFEPPTFSELAGGLRPTLNSAQRGTTIEVGTRGRRDDFDWDVAVYESRLTDELLQIATNSIGASVTVNAPRTVHRGLELGLGGNALRSATGRVEWRVVGLINEFKFRNDPTYGDSQLPGLPKYAGRAQLGYRFGNGLLLQASVEAASGYPIDFSNSFRADRYAIWGLRTSGGLAGSVSWFVDGRNLSDRKYAATTGVVRTANGTDTAQFFPGDGRSVYAGIDWRFN
jgi:iron complex outermembrane recepter protein